MSRYQSIRLCYNYLLELQEVFQQKKIMVKTLLQLSLTRERQEAIVIILRNPDAKVDALQNSQATRYQIS
jgi:hypothetical protein